MPQPSGVVLAPNLEVVDALLGAEWGPRAIIADVAKLSLADGATLCHLAGELPVLTEHVRLHWVSHEYCSSSHAAQA